MPLKFDRLLSNHAAEAPVKFQNDPVIQTTKLSDLSLHGILLKEIFSDIQTVSSVVPFS